MQSAQHIFNYLITLFVKFYNQIRARAVIRRAHAFIRKIYLYGVCLLQRLPGKNFEPGYFDLVLPCG